MEGESTSRLNGGQLARLLAIGSGEARERHHAWEPKAAARLREMLDSPFAATDSARHRTGRDAPTTLEGVLHRRGTDLALLKEIKDRNKGTVTTAASDATRAAATAVYYAAIAAALVFHGEKITRHSDARLLEGFERLQDATWIPSDLRTLIAKGRAVCAGRLADHS